MNGLRERRKAKGLSQAELAKAVGVSQTVISILETCEVEPMTGLKNALDDALGEEKRKDMKEKQVIKVLDYMRKHGGISQRDAVEFGCYRLSARIHDLREMGYDIKTENKGFRTEYGHGYYAVYSLVGGSV